MTALDTLAPRADIGAPALPPDLFGVAAADGRRRVLAVDIGTHSAAALLDEAGELLDVVDHDRAEAALIGWAGLQRERSGR